jgi:hypothetical protein
MNYIIALTTPIFLTHSTFGVYFFFGGCALFTSVVCIFFMPETKGKRLEDIQAEFRSKVSKVEQNSDVKMNGSGFMTPRTMTSENNDDGTDTYGALGKGKESVTVKAIALEE